MKVVTIPILSDNYSYLIIDKDNKSCSAIDPASPEEIIPVNFWSLINDKFCHRC